MVRALLLQVLEGPSAHAADGGPCGAGRPGTGRRRAGRRRRHRRRVQDGVPLASERDRAVPGRRDRRRRDRPGHRLDGRPAGRAARPADVRAARGRAEPLAPRGGGGRDRRLRELHRRPHRRRRGPVRRPPFGEPDRQRAVRRDRARGPTDDGRVAHAEPGLPDGPVRSDDRARRDRRRLGARVRDDRGGERGIATVRADRRPVRGEAADRGVARAGRREPARGTAGPRRRRAHVRRERVRRARGARRAPGSGRGPAAGARDGGVRDPHVRVAGTDARDRPSLEARTRPSGLREVGTRDGGRRDAGAGRGPRGPDGRRAGRSRARALADREGARLRAPDAGGPSRRRRPHVRAVRGRPRRGAPLDARRAERRVQAVGLRAVRPDGAGPDRRGARARMPPWSASRGR